MGIKLTDLVVKRPLIDGELSSRSVAFDAYNMLYQFISSIRTPEGYLLTTDEGQIISHLKGLFSRTCKLIADGVNPVFVFDGIPHDLKKGTLDLRRERKEKAQKQWEEALERGDIDRARTKAMQTSRLTKEMVDQSKRLLDLLGVPHMVAPSDGEAQASHMCRKGDVYAASSQDFDSLLFGCPLLIRNIGSTGRRKLPGRKAWVSVVPEMISLDDTLSTLGISREQLVDMAIMIGTDFNEGVKGIGPKTSLKLIKEFGNIEIISKMSRIPLLEYDEVRRIFLEPNVSDDYDIRQGRLDRDGVNEFLVTEMGFGVNGVEKTLDSIGRRREHTSQSSLDSFS